MRFIRDIIVERSADGAKPAPKPAEQPAAKAPEQSAAAAAQAANRTFTRVPDSFDEDEIFQRLMATEPKSAAKKAGAQHGDDVDVLDRILMEDSDDGADDNLFSDEDDEDDLPAARPQARAEPQRDAPAEPKAEPAADSPASPAFGAMAGRSQAAQALIDETPERAPAAPAAAAPAGDMAMPQPATGRSGRGAGRVKTRLLGFGTGDLTPRDPFASESDTDAKPRTDGFPVGWLVVVSGPGRGTSFPLQAGVSQIGRGEDQLVRLDFGDTSISRSNHAAVAYDPEQRAFFLGHGGKANMVRLNNRPVLSTEDLRHGALIRIGETTLRFVAFCDDTFAWDKDEAN